MKSQGEIDLTAHNDTKATDLEDKSNTIKELLRESCLDVQEEGVQLTAYVHFFLHCHGFKHDFIWNGVGSKALTLGELLHAPEALDEVVEKFSQLI